LKMSVDPDRWLETVKGGKHLAEEDLRLLCERVKETMCEEPNVQAVSSPVTVCGDVHGQYYDVKELLRIGGDCPGTSYIFMGDYVDRGNNSVLTIQLLLCLKARYPDRITLLRGNHECRQITQVYGFYDEIVEKYGNANPWEYCMDVFNYFNTSAVIDGSVMCVHGGLSPMIRTISQIQKLYRFEEIPHEGAIADMMWSDPDNVDGWAQSPRGAGFLFGARDTSEFLQLNGLELICRAHQLVQEGFKYMFSRKNLVTVWSAPNYCYRCGNVASILAFDGDLNREFRMFREVKESGAGMMGRANYFL